MILLEEDRLEFYFDEVHPRAKCHVSFQRTLRVPNDNRSYPLPATLDNFPLHHVDDYLDRLPESWGRHGGVFLPMYQAEAMWIALCSLRNILGNYPFAIKVAAGKINAVTGDPWSESLHAEPQDYMVIPKQRWLDGFSVAKDHVRQFVAMPLGQGYTAEEQITGTGAHGGLQLVVYPMKAEIYELNQAKAAQDRRGPYQPARFSVAFGALEMGLAPGGLIRQQIDEDPYGIEAWDQAHGLRCYVHLVNSAQYRQITGSLPPHQPPTAQEYAEAELPWFEYYSDAPALSGSEKLAGLASVQAKQSLDGVESVIPPNTRLIGKRRVVRQGPF